MAMPESDPLIDIASPDDFEAAPDDPMEWVETPAAAPDAAPAEPAAAGTPATPHVDAGPYAQPVAEAPPAESSGAETFQTDPVSSPDEPVWEETDPASMHDPMHDPLNPDEHQNP